MAKDLMDDMVRRTPDLDYHVEVRSAGIEPFPGNTPLTTELIDWADFIGVFDEYQAKAVRKMRPEADKKLQNYQVPDIYDRNKVSDVFAFSLIMAPQLRQLL